MSLSKAEITHDCRIKMKWRIKEDALKEALNNAADDYTIMKSKYFKASKIPGVEYYLSLKIDEDDPNKININFYLDFKMAKKVVATFDLYVISASYDKDDEKFSFYDKTDSWESLLCTRDKIFDAEKKFFVNKIMEIQLEGNLKTRGIKRKAPESLSLGQILWENDEDKDIIIIVKKQELKIHKWVLCAESPVFKAEMESGMKEARENRIEISDTDFSFETVKIVIEHCYEKNIKELITEENASELLHFSDKYNIKRLHHNVQFTLIDKISDTNVVKFANASVTSNAKELREFCVCFLMDAIETYDVIEDSTQLCDEITSEIGRRSFVSTAE